MKKHNIRYGLMDCELEGFTDYLKKNGYSSKNLGGVGTIINDETNFEEGLIGIVGISGLDAGRMNKLLQERKGHFFLHIEGDTKLENVVSAYYENHREWFQNSSVDGLKTDS